MTDENTMVPTIWADGSMITKSEHDLLRQIKAKILIIETLEAENQELRIALIKNTVDERSQQVVKLETEIKSLIRSSHLSLVEYETENESLRQTIQQLSEEIVKLRTTLNIERSYNF